MVVRSEERGGEKDRKKETASSREIFNILPSLLVGSTTNVCKNFLQKGIQIFDQIW